MPNAHGIAVEIAKLALQVVVVAGTGAAVVVYTWDTTRSAARTLFVAVLVVTAARMVYIRYRIRRTKERRRYFLPTDAIRYPGSTAI